jgi:hypothetical protein
MLKLLDINVQFQTITFITMNIHTTYCKNWSHGSEVDRGDKKYGYLKSILSFHNTVKLGYRKQKIRLLLLIQCSGHYTDSKISFVV